MKQKIRNFTVILSLAISFVGISIMGIGQAQAQEKSPWPHTYEDWSTGKAVQVDYTGIEKASKKWKLFSLVPFDHNFVSVLCQTDQTAVPEDVPPLHYFYRYFDLHTLFRIAHIPVSGCFFVVQHL